MDLDFNLKVGLRHPKLGWLCIESKKAEENKYTKLKELFCYLK